MTLPSLPTQGSTSWFPWASAIDDAVRNGTGGGGNDEYIRDVVGATLVAGDGIIIAPDDAGDTIVISTTGTTVVSVKDFGAIGDGITDDTGAIQAAIDYCLYTAGTKRVLIPYGIYKTSDVIHIGYGDDYRTLIFEGETSQGADQTTALAAIVPTFNDRPAINIQGARNVQIRNLALIGRNYEWLYPNYTSITDRSSLAAWYGPNISSANNTRYAPYAGIAVDAYAGTEPGTPYPDVTYPAESGLSSQYGKNYSSGIVLDNVYVRGFVVGVMVQPGIVPDGSNGDFITVRDSDLQFNVVGYADGHADARNVNMQNCRLHFCHTAVDSLTYGNQHGSLALNADGCSFDNVYRILNVNMGGNTVQGGYPVRLVSCYAEALYSIGNVYASSSSLTTGAVIEESKFTFVYKSGEYSPIYLYNAPGTDLYLRNVFLNGAWGFHSFNAHVIGQSVALDKLSADVFPSTNTAGRVAKTYTCGLWATSAPRMRVFPHRFFTYFGENKSGTLVDSEALPVELDATAPAGTGAGFPIPWFVNQMSYGRSRLPIADVAPLTFSRATYNLTSFSTSGNQHTFTVSQAIISDALGSGAVSSGYQSYSIGKGDVLVDNTTGLVFYVVSVTFNGTTDATLTVRQINGVRTTDGGTTWTATGTISTTVGTMTIHNARRVYPSAKRTNFTATSGSGAVSLRQNGSETTVANNFLPAAVGDYLISSAASQGPADSVFPQTKVTAANQGNGAYTLDQNARRSYYGDTPMFIKGTL